MNPNNKPKNFKDVNGKMGQAGKVNTQSSQPNKSFNQSPQNSGFKRPTESTSKSASSMNSSSMNSMKSHPNSGLKRSEVNSTEKVEKTSGQPNRFNNSKK